MIDRLFGVWAGPDCELVRTPGFSLLFQRVGTGGAAALALVSMEQGRVVYDTRLLAFIDPEQGESRVRACDLTDGREPLVELDPDNRLSLGRHALAVTATDDRLVLSLGGRAVEELAGDRLHLLTPLGTLQTLEMVERIAPVEPAPGRECREGEVAACLQEWALGTSVWQNPDTGFVSLNIGTNRHSFAAGFGPVGDDSFVLLRAARVRATRHGAVFVHDCRLVDGSGELTAFLAPDLLAAAREDVKVDVLNFSHLVNRPTDAGVYWLLDRFEPDTITLKGSGAREYRFERPTEDNPALVERFGFREYREALARPG